MIAMTMAHPHIEDRGHTLPFRGLLNSCEDHQNVPNHHYRLPPPHSSIPLGLAVDDRRHERPRAMESVPQLPSVRHLLYSEETSPYGSPYHGRSPRSSPPLSQRSLDSQLRIRSLPEIGNATFRPLTAPGGKAYDMPQSTRLPSLSQVGIEPPRSHSSKDHDFPTDQYGREYTISPGGSTHGSPVMQQHHGMRQERSTQVPTLPSQVVEERYVPGKGICYIFADQSHCPKSIDGEPVNPNWGLTKAGKARKRLAQACIPCREKKIKCHPNQPRCDQCQKSGRDCRFESAPRGNRARSSSYEPHTARPRSRQMMRSMPSSPREVDLALHSLPQTSISPPAYGATPALHQTPSEGNIAAHAKDVNSNPAHMQKRRKRESPYENVEGRLYLSTYHGDVAKIRQTFAAHSDWLGAGYWSKF